MRSIKWPGMHVESPTVIIPIDEYGLPLSNNTLNINGDVFLLKNEVHVTLFGKTLGAEMIEKIEKSTTFEHDIKTLFENVNWLNYTNTGPVHFLEKSINESSVKKSIITLIDMPGFYEFYKILSKLLNTSIPIPPPHVTLYTFNHERGISVQSRAALDHPSCTEMSSSQFETVLEII